MSDDISLLAMANEATLSATHLSKAFKNSVGVSLLQYVIAARMDLASVYLRTTELSVATISWRVGYDDASRFNQHFKRKFKTTPATFRSHSA
ncbi:helix-turn-helix transcriptional regulator [Parasulfitobacter algicola]|uniref:Helix-turn-helix transcriptional regulator n=1 Tax=Parasulfitobacter algicola TaxID=2614809 RepID=A0ABX2IU40_9RHOB|nr:helix-turn-helix transcriptional regulator [Sulfitobacter algicola]